jgi:hypothetical protein
MIASLFCVAQSTVLQLFENTGFGNATGRANPRLLGKVGSNYLMMDYSRKGTSLTVFDSSFRFLNLTEQIPDFFIAHKNIEHDSLRVTWNESHTDEEWLCLQTFDQNGKCPGIRIVTMDNPEHRFINYVTDKLSRLHLFYSLHISSAQNVILKGMVLDNNWQKLRDISGTFKMNMSLERAPVPMIDVLGNIHVFVYDKLSNYRLSAKLTVNTLLSGEDNFREETFSFDKLKLYDPYFSEDPERKQFLMRDFFYDGQTKEKKGIVTLRIPYERGAGIVSLIQQIPDSVQVLLRSHTKNLRARQPVIESLITTEVFENNAATVFLTDLLDLPIHQLVRDVEVEPEQRNQNRSRYRNSGPRYSDQQSPSGGNSGTTSQSWQDRVRQGPTATNLGSSSVEAYSPPPTGSSSRNTNPSIWFPQPVNEKRLVFFIDSADNIKWYQYLPEEYTTLKFSMESPVSYVMKNESEWQFLHYHDNGFAAGNYSPGDNHPYDMAISLTRISPTGITSLKAKAVCDAGIKFFKPLMLSEGKYLMPYTNVLLKKSGLALLQMQDSNKRN